MATELPHRPTSNFCYANVHAYCLRSHFEECQCNCHFSSEPYYKGILDLTFSLWKADAIQQLEGESKEACNHRSIGLISVMAEYFDTCGLSAEVYLEAIKPIVAKPYWSRVEAEEHFKTLGVRL